MEQKQGKNNEIVINTVEIGNTISQKDSKTLSDDDKQEVKDYISETYDKDKKNIFISYIISVFPFKYKHFKW